MLSMMFDAFGGGGRKGEMKKRGEGVAGTKSLASYFSSSGQMDDEEEEE